MDGQNTISRLMDELSALRDAQANGNSTIERQTVLIEKLYKKIDELTEANKEYAQTIKKLPNSWLWPTKNCMVPGATGAHLRG